ncbi:hypothetical protein FHR32_008204 [Streptosporangium album]|uniref:Uncharacterized protein n=1 Tax=Streptosporangium album TaxID=47479 RepID=A0A7W7S4M2_9ACTN|nr:hypothetical protein [Streptosporangium album]MBB4943803.1 hypothetical protein [Streptosporangium album]
MSSGTERTDDRAGTRVRTDGAAPAGRQVRPRGHVRPVQTQWLEHRCAGGIDNGINTVHLAYIRAGDEVYGACPQLRTFLEEHRQAYVLRVRSSFTLTLGGGTRLTCEQVVAKHLKQKRRWTIRSAGDGSKGERTYAWVWIATAGPDQQPPEDPGMIPLTIAELKHLSNAATTTSRSLFRTAYWSAWRRRHQARARWVHRRARLTTAYSQLN